MAMRFRAARTLRRPVAVPAQEKVAALIALTYELLDAHADTAQLAVDEAGDADWRDHLAYLRDLQRVGRVTLAQAEVARDLACRAPAPTGRGRGRARLSSHRRAK
jgi:hypothetical protein